ncbi:MAG: DegT/DnrJ/EryC1/StrS family aminotransferase [Alphaproteobacteria bacterium]|nr:DegT/DnrJ/EryC1/StrS family aminotransferase [Alphaproteobacteria bacterium]
MKRIPVAGPSITEKEIDYVIQAMKGAWYENAGVFNQRFERAFAAHCGRRHAVSLPSCTAGLHLALMAFGVSPGDDVIVPDCTWIASAAPIRYVGATPVFADIDPASWCLSAEAFERSITPRTKAAIVVDLYGSMPDWDALMTIAAHRGVALIEDAAEATGSRWRDRPAGAFGAVAAFSFHGSKTLTTGEGGMVVLDDDVLHARILKLRDHGRDPGDFMFTPDSVGWKYKMSALQAALGLAQLERLPELVAKKRQIFSWYRAALEDWNGIKLNPDVNGLYNSYWMTTAVVDPELRVGKERLVLDLRERGVDVRPFFSPLSDIPAFRDTPEAKRARQENRQAYAISPFAVNLPSALSLTESDVARVITSLRESVSTLATRR